MGKVDEVHDAENQRQAGREQEQQQPELQPIQELFNDEEHGNISDQGVLSTGSVHLSPVGRGRFAPRDAKHRQEQIG